MGRWVQQLGGRLVCGQEGVVLREQEEGVRGVQAQEEVSSGARHGITSSVTGVKIRCFERTALGIAPYHHSVPPSRGSKGTVGRCGVFPKARRVSARSACVSCNIFGGARVGSISTARTHF